MNALAGAAKKTGLGVWRPRGSLGACVEAVVLACETGGQWSAECLALVRQLADLKVETVPIFIKQHTFPSACQNG